MDDAPAVPLTNQVNPNGTDTVSPSDAVNDKIFQQMKPGAAGMLAAASLPGQAAYLAAHNALAEGGELGLSPQTEQKLRDAGWYNDYAAGEFNFGKAVNEGLLKPAAIAADAAMRGFNAGATGIAAAGFGVLNDVESFFGGAKESPETVAHEAEDFTNFLYINSGFAEDGMPIATSAKTEEGAATQAKAETLHEPTGDSASLNIPVKPESAILDDSGNLNLKYINADSNVKEVLAQTAQAYAEKNGTVVSNLETTKQAQAFLDTAMQQTANGIPDVLATLNRGDPVNRNLLMSARQLVVQSGNDYLKLAKIAGETGAQADIDAATEAYGRLEILQGIRHEVSAEAGRTAQAHQIPVGEGSKDIEGAVEKLTSAGLPPEDVHKIAATLDTPQQIAKFASDAKKPTFSDAVLYYVINNYLSGPLTHAAYAASYLAQSIIRAGIETPIASLVGKIQTMAGKSLSINDFAKLKTERQSLLDRLAEADSIQGRKLLAPEAATMQKRIKEIEAQTANAITVMPKETAARFYGVGQGYVDAVKASWRALKNDAIQSLPKEKAMSTFGRNPIITMGRNIDNPVLSSIVETGGKIVGIPSRVVGAIHTFQKFLSYSESLNALAYRQAASEGLKGSILNKATGLGARIAQLKNDPPVEMMRAATDEGLYAALMGEGGKAGERFEAWAGSNNFTKAMVPFSRVMNNINSQTFLERTPLGVFSEKVRGDISGKNGNAAQATAIGKMVVGTTILGGAAALTAQGYIHGAASDKPKERAFAYLSGNPPYSVRFGDINIPLRFLGIPGRILATGADFHDVSQATHDEDDLTSAIGMAAHDIGENVLSESGFRGIAELYEAITDYERYGKYYVQKAVASAFLPFSVGQGQITRVIDPTIRQAHSILEEMKSKSPFYSSTLVPNIDIFGNPMQRNGSPAWAEKDPAMLALNQLEIYPSPVGKRLSNVTLSEKQWADYATVAGKIFYLDLSQKVNEPRWVKLDAEAQAELVQEATKYSRKQAQKYMRMTYPELAKKSAKQNLDLANPE